MPEFRINSPAMATLMHNVADFHEATDTPVYFHMPEIPEAKRCDLRIRLIEEEVAETIKAIRENDIVEVADGLADIIYVVIGTALEFGIPLDLVWAEVQRSNMAKVDPETGKVTKRDDGKVLKPAGWTPPNIAACLED
jgi:predicted HAD superfamily Cof-like phosphohydrolase